jgi:hypothetical protein
MTCVSPQWARTSCARIANFSEIGVEGSVEAANSLCWMGQELVGPMGHLLYCPWKNLGSFSNFCILRSMVTKFQMTTSFHGCSACERLHSNRYLCLEPYWIWKAAKSTNVGLQLTNNKTGPFSTSKIPYFFDFVCWDKSKDLVFW